MNEAPWKWWAGSNEEHFTIGPCDTREEALAEAEGEGWWVIHLTEAKQDPIDFSEMIDGRDIFERWLEDDEQLYTEDGDCCVSVSDGLLADLDEMLKMAVRHWQAKHGINQMRYYFSAQRNGETIHEDNDPENTEGTY